MAGAVDKKLLRQTKFPPEFNQKVDMKKVNVEVMKKWIAGKISEILGAEDDVVIELCFNLLEGSRFPDIKTLQIQLTGFLEKDTATFCKELWILCLSAQSNPQGVPKELLEAKKLELIQEKIEAEKAAEAARQRREQERNKERELDRIRQRERAERGDRNRGYGRGARDSREFDRRAPRDYPDRRRNAENHQSSSKRREVDTYIPIPNSRGNERYRSRSPNEGRTQPTHRRVDRSESRSSSRSRSRSNRNSRSNEDRGVELARNSKRGDDRAKYNSSERFRSRSPRPDYRRSKRSSSTSSDSSTSPKRDKSSHKTHRGRNKTRPGSDSSSSSSPNRRGSKAREERSSSSPEDLGNVQQADVDKGQLKGTEEQSSRQIPKRGRSDSPKHRAKRRPSMDRYEPRAKRRRNTSSSEGSGASGSDKASDSN